MHLPDISKDSRVKDIIRRALKEDVGRGDVTTLALVPKAARVTAVMLARHRCTVAGTSVAKAVFKAVDSSLKCTVVSPDGSRVGKNQVMMRISGSARAILTAERTALNIVQRLTGIATLTSRFVEIAGKHGVAILDTRKTTPTLRFLEKYAVLCGGGRNHRFGLYDKFLIKDNHRRLWRKGAAPRLDEAIRQARKAFPGIEVEVEVESIEELQSALKEKPEWVLLDNMTPALMKRCSKLCSGRSKLEASGGITLRNIQRVAASGVDAVSLGCLTHSAPAADISLEIE